MNKYFRYPVNWVAISTYFSNSHLAFDYGWNSSHGGKNVGVYAVSNGTVFDIGKSIGTNNAGNYVWTRHSYNEKYDILTRYAHLKDGSIKVKKGQSIKQSQQIGNMGGTYGYAEHLHHDVWLVPKSYKFNWNDRKKYAVNPVDYLVLFENQSHGESAKGVMRLLGTSKSVKKDTSKNQIEVIGYKLRVRKGAGTNQAILGYCDYGIYNYTATKTANGYTWYNLGFGWIAGTKEDTKVYLKTEKQEETNNTSNIEVTELKKEIATLKETISKLDFENKNLKNQLDNQTKYKSFTAKEHAIYYIELKKGSKLYQKV